MNLEFLPILEERGMARLNIDTTTIYYYLGTIYREVVMNNRFSVISPFRSIEDAIEELTIHEILHDILRIHEDEIIDGWHALLCRLINNKEKCDCPIPCEFRQRKREDRK